MDFRFDLSPLLKAHIVRVASNLLPQGFTGDRRAASEASSKISEIINALGEVSAKAQGLNKPVTTAQKLRNSDHIVYLLSEKTGKNGCVTGLLKVGTKNLYVFDTNGDTQMVSAPCILDFYIHESRQRAGLGKELFQVMLEREEWEPKKLAIDRPSEKLVGFLRKHYGLIKTIPQMNNFVVYDGFFDGDQNDNVIKGGTDNRIHELTRYGPHFTNEHIQRTAAQSHLNSPSVPHMCYGPIGRYGAKRPTCSMAEIIQNLPASITIERHSVRGNGDTNQDELDHFHHHHHHQRNQNDEELNAYEQRSIPENDIDPENDAKDEYPDIVSSMETLNISRSGSETAAIDDILNSKQKEVKFAEQHEGEEPNIGNDGKKASRYTKQHTGLKNISFNVGAAVTPTDKMEFDQEERESFGVVKINRPIGKLSPNVDNSDAHSTVSSVGSEGLTEQGYFDLKFYHNKLW